MGHGLHKTSCRHDYNHTPRTVHIVLLSAFTPPDYIGNGAGLYALQSSIRYFVPSPPNVLASCVFIRQQLYRRVIRIIDGHCFNESMS